MIEINWLPDVVSGLHISILLYITQFPTVLSLVSSKLYPHRKEDIIFLGRVTLNNCMQYIATYRIGL
jgi:hypothetical protein